MREGYEPHNHMTRDIKRLGECPACDFYLAHVMYCAEDWCKITGIQIADPDGWRGKGQSWDDLITRAEFIRRATLSTTMLAWPHPLLDEMRHPPMKETP